MGMATVLPEELEQEPHSGRTKTRTILARSEILQDKERCRQSDMER